MRVVLDTNILISGMIVEKGLPAAILRAWQKGDFMMVTSQSLVDEFAKITHQPHLKSKYKLTDERVEEMIVLMRAKAILTPGLYEVKVIEDDPDDDVVIACALEGQAGYIVSGDSHLLNLKEYRGVSIVSAKEFLRIVEEAKAQRET